MGERYIILEENMRRRMLMLGRNGGKIHYFRREYEEEDVNGGEKWEKDTIFQKRR